MHALNAEVLRTVLEKVISRCISMALSVFLGRLVLPLSRLPRHGTTIRKETKREYEDLQKEKSFAARGKIHNGLVCRMAFIACIS